MSKFNKTTAKAPTATSFIKTESVASANTFEGAPGFARDAKSELFLLAVSNMVGENTFYEKSSDRDERFRTLVRAVAVQDPDWIGRLFSWLRSEANMRSASVVGALEAAKAMVDAKVPGSRSIVDSALQRADEPGEALAYWISTYGRRLPKPVKRGIADAAQRLYTEYSLLKYDTASHGFRFADVLDLTHAQPKAPWQGRLYKFALDRRHDREGIVVGDELSMVRNNAAIRAQVNLGNFSSLLDPELVKAAGLTWEDILSLAGSKVDKAQLWEALIPSMGYMALLRNLRNFDIAGVSGTPATQVAARLADPDAVAKSRQFPFRFLSAYRATQSLRWGQALETAMNLSLANIPELPGRTLVLVDTSGSMDAPMSTMSDLKCMDAAAVFGAALALRNVGRTTLVQFGSSSNEIPVPKGGSLLKLLGKFQGLGGTYTATATRTHYAGHDRVVIVTDEQAHDGDPGSIVPAHVPLYTWNLAGYRFGHGAGKANRHTFGGLTDQAFKLIPLLERGTDQDWPF